MTRISSFAAWTVLASMTAFAASRAETTTYVDGNLAGVSPNTGGTLLFSDEKTLVFRTGLATITVPYTAVTKSELGEVRETAHDGPRYKAWMRHQKKTETQFLTVEFKNEEGANKTMTLELAQGSAASALSIIQEHTGRTEVAGSQRSIASGKPIIDPHDRGSKASPATKPGSDWWGDDMWKTTRNSSGWSKPTGTIAPEE